MDDQDDVNHLAIAIRCLKEVFDPSLDVDIIRLRQAVRWFEKGQDIRFIRNELHPEFPDYAARTIPIIESVISNLTDKLAAETKRRNQHDMNLLYDAILHLKELKKKYYVKTLKQIIPSVRIRRKK
jgi:hypothetical protein